MQRYKWIKGSPNLFLPSTETVVEAKLNELLNHIWDSAHISNLPINGLHFDRILVDDMEDDVGVNPGWGDVYGNQLSHQGAVKYFRQQFKEYSKEEFREMSNQPVIKEILAGASVIPKEDVVERIRQHLENVAC